MARNLTPEAYRAIFSDGNAGQAIMFALIEEPLTAQALQESHDQRDFSRILALMLSAGLLTLDNQTYSLSQDGKTALALFTTPVQE